MSRPFVCLGRRYCDALPLASGGENARKTRSHRKNFLGNFRFRGVVFVLFIGKECIGLSTPRKGKIEESPGFCKTEDLARLFRLSNQSVNQLTRDGIIKRRDTPAGRRYNVMESVGAYVEYLRDRAAGRAEKGIPESKELEKFEAEVRIKQAKAQIAELEAQELQGIMHRSEDVAALTEDLLYTVRNSLLALPGRLAVDVAGTGTAAEAAEIIKREVFLVMKDLSDYRYDPEKYAERVRERMDWQAEHGGEEDDE